MKEAENQQMQEAEKAQQDGQSISSHVNQEYVNQIVEMGFTKIVAEKALFFCKMQGAETTEKALEWIDQHQDDADFHEELKIVGYAFQNLF